MHICEFCGSELSTKSSLDKHQKTVVYCLAEQIKKNCIVSERLTKPSSKKAKTSSSETPKKKKVSTRKTKSDEKSPKSRVAMKAMSNTLFTKYITETNQVKCVICSTLLLQHNMQVGHVISRKNGGSDTIDNLRPICGSCNSSLGETNVTDYLRNHDPAGYLRFQEEFVSKNDRPENNLQGNVHLPQLKAEQKEDIQMLTFRHQKTIDYDNLWEKSAEIRDRANMLFNQGTEALFRNGQDEKSSLNFALSWIRKELANIVCHGYSSLRNGTYWMKDKSAEEILKKEMDARDQIKANLYRYRYNNLDSSTSVYCPAIKTEFNQKFRSDMIVDHSKFLGSKDYLYQF
jgi:5-methylcytosine-specific restriction endonuclease McrA